MSIQKTLFMVSTTFFSTDVSSPPCCANIKLPLPDDASLIFSYWMLIIVTIMCIIMAIAFVCQSIPMENGNREDVEDIEVLVRQTVHTRVGRMI